MAYTMIQDFAGGLDLRKSSITTKAGSLRQLKNASINAGGEIEKRKTLTQVAVLPAGTKGLGFGGGKATVFGTAAAAPGVMPAYTQYHRLIVSDGATITKVLAATTYADKFYVTARMSDGTLRHFFDGVEVAARRNQGYNAIPYQTKMYVPDGKNLRFSAVGDPTDTTGTGSGIIDVTAQDIGSTQVLAVEPYYDKLAVLGQTSIQLWAMDVDPLQNSQMQVLGNIGLVAPFAVAQYGTGDVLFLSHTGIRSLRARDSSNSAVLNDIGSPIDTLISAKRAVITPEKAEAITALVDPLTGQFWMVWGEQVFVLSLYTSSKITAWATYEFSFEFDNVMLANSRILVRRGDELFVYGTVAPGGNPFDVNAAVGVDPAEYDASEVVVELPFMDFGSPATTKEWQGLDVACEGVWDVYVNPEFRNPGAWIKVATITQPSYAEERIPLTAAAGRSTHLAVKLVSASAGAAKLSAIGVHYNSGEAS